MGFTRGQSELVLVVTNAMESIAFYRDVVGLELESLEVGNWGWPWTGRPETQIVDYNHCTA